MASTTQGDYPLATVQFSRLTKRGVMLGLSLPQLVILAVAVLTVVAGLYTGGGMGLAWTSPVWGIATLLAVIPAGGRKLIHGAFDGENVGEGPQSAQRRHPHR